MRRAVRIMFVRIGDTFIVVRFNLNIAGASFTFRIKEMTAVDGGSWVGDVTFMTLHRHSNTCWKWTNLSMDVLDQIRSKITVAGTDSSQYVDGNEDEEHDRRGNSC